MAKKITKNSIVTKAKKQYSNLTLFLKKHPLGSFFIVLGLLLLVLIVGKILQKPVADQTQKPQAKMVKVYF